MTWTWLISLGNLLYHICLKETLLLYSADFANYVTQIHDVRLCSIALIQPMRKLGDLSGLQCLFLIISVVTDLTHNSLKMAAITVLQHHLWLQFGNIFHAGVAVSVSAIYIELTCGAFE